MKKIITAIIFLSALSFIILFTGCKKKDLPQNTSLSYDTAEVDIPFPDTTDISDNDSLQFHAQRVKGYSAKHWGKVFKNCMSSVFITKKDADYLGNGNTLGLGTITDKEIDNIYDRVDETIFSKEEMKIFIDTGKYISCNYVMSGKVDIEALAGGEIGLSNISDPLSIEVQAAIKTNKDVQFTIKKFRKQALFLNRLMQALDDTTNTKKRELRKLILNPENQIIKTAIVIKGFEAEIKLGEDISPGLKARLTTTPATAAIGNISVDAKVQVVNTRTLKISSDEEFVIFGKFGTVKIQK